MMSQTTLPKSFWDYALESAIRILNMVPTKKIEKTPYEVWHGQAPKLSIKCIFVGYPKETIGYSFYYPPENKIFVAWNAEFFENSLINQKASRSLEDLEINQEEDTHPSIDTSSHHDEDDLEIDEPQSDINPIVDNKVWDLVDLPPNGKTVGSKWLFKKKTNMDGVVHTFKARFVAKGFTQTYGVDYEEIFSPIAYIRAIRILIAITTFYDYEIWQMDIKTVFLNGHLSEEVYMVQYVKSYLGRCFPMKDLGEAAYILGIKIDKDRSKQLIGASTPQRMKNVSYALVVGSIMYVVRCTRPDVAFAHNITNRFQQNPGELHWTAVKNIMKWCMTRSSTKELLSTLENPERVLRSRRKLFDNPSLVETVRQNQNNSLKSKSTLKKKLQK
ncbi:retrotransposon protein, putative, ty1-copia subclass [Tanacetum coccineum]